MDREDGGGGYVVIAVRCREPQQQHKVREGLAARYPVFGAPSKTQKPKQSSHTTEKIFTEQAHRLLVRTAPPSCGNYEGKEGRQGSGEEHVKKKQK